MRAELGGFEFKKCHLSLEIVPSYIEFSELSPNLIVLSFILIPKKFDPSFHNFVPFSP
jgi:hypothetical protein